MKRTIPLIITFSVGLIVVLSEFIPHYPFSNINQGLENWFIIISSFAVILGLISLIHLNLSKIINKAENWQFYLAGLIAFVIMTAFGFLWGTEERAGFLGHGLELQAVIGCKPFDYLFNNVMQHLSATMFSLLAFFIASAAYRAFIVRSFESNLLMITAVIVMLGRTGLGTMLTGWLPENYRFWHLPILTDFIMKYPSNAAQRAIMISAALGVIGSSLRIILGIERAHLGGD